MAHFDACSTRAGSVCAESFLEPLFVETIFSVLAKNLMQLALVEASTRGACLACGRVVSMRAAWVACGRGQVAGCGVCRPGGSVSSPQRWHPQAVLTWGPLLSAAGGAGCRGLKPS